ncbi:hypothetical protein L1987_09162 [Smallanthus sonchifolius]|uniref:Uncharacterized protein n=1 Tax=Smallanthus sonchifolius TaxID=185202 RepID=A0ACB9JNQ9_9ASTR|nr:hypothetical protein L1987_09162 [Smallanthus sonchifolius]
MVARRKEKGGRRWNGECILIFKMVFKEAENVQKEYDEASTKLSKLNFWGPYPDMYYYRGAIGIDVGLEFSHCLDVMRSHLRSVLWDFWEFVGADASNGLGRDTGGAQGGSQLLSEGISMGIDSQDQSPQSYL